jgi:hypothetical protein
MSFLDKRPSLLISSATSGVALLSLVLDMAFLLFWQVTGRKGGRRCRSLRCPVPQTRFTAELEEPAYSVVSSLRALEDYAKPKLQVVPGLVDDKLKLRTAWHHLDASVSVSKGRTEERLLEKVLSLSTGWKMNSQSVSTTGPNPALNRNKACGRLLRI